MDARSAPNRNLSSRQAFQEAEDLPCLCVSFAGHKKHHRPRARAASSSNSAAAASEAFAAPAPPPVDNTAPADTSAASAIPAASAPRRTAAQTAAAPPDLLRDCDGNVVTRDATNPQYEQQWEHMQALHDSQGVGYLAAFIQASPDLRPYASVQRDAAYRIAAARLCQAAHHHAEHTCIDTAIAVLQEALKESLTTLSLEHQATLCIQFELGHILQDAGESERALRAWLWLAPRAQRLPYEQYQSGFHIRMNATSCLMRLNRHAEAIPIAKAMFDGRRATHGVDDSRTMSALNTMLHCYDQALTSEDLSIESLPTPPSSP